MPIPKYYVRPDGLHESIITVNGKRKAFRGKTDREVWNKIKAYRAEAEKPKTVPFSDVAHAWWNEIEPTLAPNSLRNYSPAYERAVAQFGPEDVATITSKEIETYINQFAKTHAKKTVITQRQIIRQILNKAQREGYVSFNAAQAVLLPKNLPQKHRHAPPADQIQKIKDNLNDDFGLFAFLIYYTGCRRGELCALKWSDFRSSGDGFLLTVSRSRSIVAGKGVVEGSTKNGRSRQIILSPALRGVLLGYRWWLVQEAAKRRRDLSPYLFVNEQGQLLHPDTFTKRLRKIYAANGFPAEYHLHTLRHFFVSTLLHSGIDKQTVAELAGHCDTGFLERTYCHPEMERKKDAAASMLTSLHPGDGTLFPLQMAVGK